MDFQHMPSKKFIYVKQHVMDSIKNGQSKVLINPNFMKPPVVHINPHFKTNLTIHINPNVIKAPLALNTNKPLTFNKSNLIVANPVHVQPIITRNKVIRVPTKSQITNKYKIVNNNCNSPKVHKHRFKIDNRTKSKVTLTKKVKYVGNLFTRNVFVKCNKRLPQSRNNLNRKPLINTKISPRKKLHFLTIRGERYKVHSNNRTLTLLTHKVTSNNKVFLFNNANTVKPKKNLYVKNNIGKQVLISQAKYKRINVSKNKLKKSNMPCPFYRKLGRCKGKENGTCIRIHNADQISLCTKFLQGDCRNESCLLSHKVSAEKMPTCRFYLEGMCSKEDCCYLHVKINAKEEICRDFLEGFCKKAAECDKRHQYLCHDFELHGSCKRNKCQYPHRNVVSENKVFKFIPSKLQTQSKTNSKLKPCSSTNIKEVPEKLSTLRYYDESVPKCKNPEVQTDCDKGNEPATDTDTTANESFISSTKRPTLGNLPSFIPFMQNEHPR